MNELGCDTDGVEVLCLWSIHFGRFLCQQRHHSVGALQLTQCLYAVFTANSDRGNGPREEDVVAKRNDRHLTAIVRMHQLFGLT